MVGPRARIREFLDVGWPESLVPSRKKVMVDVGVSKGFRV